MANEIQITSQIKVDNGSFKLPRMGLQNVRFDQSGVGGGQPGTQSIATSEAAISIPGITTLGWTYMVNLDDTNYVVWGPESGGSMVPMGRMEPGESALFRMEPGITLRMQANTAACEVQIFVLED